MSTNARRPGRVPSSKLRQLLIRHSNNRVAGRLVYGWKTLLSKTALQVSPSMHVDVRRQGDLGEDVDLLRQKGPLGSWKEDAKSVCSQGALFNCR